MMTARITQAVIAPRLATLGIFAEVGRSAMGFLAAREREQALPALDQVRHEIRQAARVIRIDVDSDAHSHAQRWLAFGVFDSNAHGDALHDLDPVSRRVLGWQQREARTRGRADALHHAVPFDAWVGIDGDRRRLTRFYIGQLRKT